MLPINDFLKSLSQFPRIRTPATRFWNVLNINFCSTCINEFLFWSINVINTLQCKNHARDISPKSLFLCYDLFRQLLIKKRNSCNGRRFCSGMLGFRSKTKLWVNVFLQLYSFPPFAICFDDNEVNSFCSSMRCGNKVHILGGLIISYHVLEKICFDRQYFCLLTIKTRPAQSWRILSFYGAQTVPQTERETRQEIVTFVGKQAIG